MGWDSCLLVSPAVPGKAEVGSCEPKRKISVLMKSLDECKFWKREEKKFSKFLA